MSMFCFQCQETAKNQGCTLTGVCGKKEDTANLQDLLIYIIKGISIWLEKAKGFGLINNKAGLFIAKSLFSTITNANFDNTRFIALIKEALKIREQAQAKFLKAYKEKNRKNFEEKVHDSATWYSDDEKEFEEKAKKVGVLSTQNEDVRS